MSRLLSRLGRVLLALVIPLVIALVVFVLTLSLFLVTKSSQSSPTSRAVYVNPQYLVNYTEIFGFPYTIDLPSDLSKEATSKLTWQGRLRAPWTTLKDRLNSGLQAPSPWAWPTMTGWFLEVPTKRREVRPQQSSVPSRSSLVPGPSPSITEATRSTLAQPTPVLAKLVTLEDSTVADVLVEEVLGSDPLMKQEATWLQAFIGLLQGLGMGVGIWVFLRSGAACVYVYHDTIDRNKVGSLLMRGTSYRRWSSAPRAVTGLASLCSSPIISSTFLLLSSMATLLLRPRPSSLAVVFLLVVGELSEALRECHNLRMRLLSQCGFYEDLIERLDLDKAHKAARHVLLPPQPSGDKGKRKATDLANRLAIVHLEAQLACTKAELSRSRQEVQGVREERDQLAANHGSLSSSNTQLQDKLRRLELTSSITVAHLNAQKGALERVLTGVQRECHAVKEERDRAIATSSSRLYKNQEMKDKLRRAEFSHSVDIVHRAAEGECLKKELASVRHERDTIREQHDESCRQLKAEQQNSISERQDHEQAMQDMTDKLRLRTTELVVARTSIIELRRNSDAQQSINQTLAAERDSCAARAREIESELQQERANSNRLRSDLEAIRANHGEMLRGVQHQQSQFTAELQRRHAQALEESRRDFQMKLEDERRTLAERHAIQIESLNSTIEVNSQLKKTLTEFGRSLQRENKRLKEAITQLQLQFGDERQHRLELASRMKAGERLRFREDKEHEAEQARLEALLSQLEAELREAHERLRQEDGRGMAGCEGEGPEEKEEVADDDRETGGEATPDAFSDHVSESQPESSLPLAQIPRSGIWQSRWARAPDEVDDAFSLPSTSEPQGRGRGRGRGRGPGPTNAPGRGRGSARGGGQGGGRGGGYGNERGGRGYGRRGGRGRGYPAPPYPL